MAKFQPGQSGNPGGRPRGLQRVTDLARQHTEEAVETLVAIMRDETAAPTARAAAASQLLDRGWGKPLQPVDVGGNPLEQFSDEDLAYLIDILRERDAALAAEQEAGGADLGMAH